MKRLGKILRELFTIALLALILFSARSSLADHYVVPTSSMEYTLMPGDRVLVNKTAYGLRLPFIGWRLTNGERPSAGEVVVFDSPETGKRLIKRIVAVGGDAVEIRGEHLVLNGETTALADDPWLEEIGDRVARLNLSDGGGPAYGPEVIPEGHVLVMGDYRGNSHDGRMFGVIPEAVIYGRAIAVFLRSGDGLTWLGL
jgi:signal peptidase I